MSGKPGGITAELLGDLQREVRELEAIRGTLPESIIQKSLILSEETFEVLKVLRPRAGIATSYYPDRSLGEELADILFVGAAIANRIPIRLDMAWGQVTGGRCRTLAAKSSPADEKEILQATIDLAERVLTVVSDCRLFDASQGDSSPMQHLTEALGKMAFQVDCVAGACNVDMKGALSEKLTKDQFRVWSS
ncbi:hypothetical protein ACIBL8_47085 [Streptomyces sp. NPDC050523]|uniref:hypothetical protein n=1 Tax=Streptomyces sp. NPDC050523 TaxID=3365622 RepID=UPI0037A39035